MPKTAVRYANGLVDANVGSLDRLKKKLAKNPRFLSQLEFDEDDVEEILSKLSLGGTIEESSTAAVAAEAVPSEETVSLAGTLQTTLSGHASDVISVVELSDRR